MPEKWLLWCSLGISCVSICLAAACAIASLRLASRFTRVLSRKPPSESTLSKLAIDQAALFSQLDSLATTVKRLSSRRGMAELRESRANPAPETKEEFRKRMLAGKSHAEIVAQARGNG